LTASTHVPYKPAALRAQPQLPTDPPSYVPPAPEVVPPAPRPVLEQAPVSAPVPPAQVATAPLKVMLEMRPALEGFAGIPQETRLLFRGLRMLDGVGVQGLLQHANIKLSRGTQPARAGKKALSAANKFNQYSRVIVSLGERPLKNVLLRQLEKLDDRFSTLSLLTTTMLRFPRLKLTDFEAEHFGDFVWRSMFAKTLPSSDFSKVTRGSFKVCTTSWRTMHKAGISSLNLSPRAVYPKLDTTGVDIFIAQTPYPARLTKGTSMVVRYHDAIPIFMPHLIPDKALHQATHMHALTENVRAGAYFACVSEATRQELLKIYPQAEPRAVTIHNMVSPHYVNEPASPERVAQIVRTRLYQHPGLVPEFVSLREQENFYGKHLAARPFRYLLAVSTIEPRKNHLRLLSGWEALKAKLMPDVRLVVVGTLGWDNDAVTKGFAPWIERGEVFCLNAVPASDLKVLYRHAAATVCPSLSEGFDYSGVESMASGGVVVASDIPAHREIYGDAAVFFDPYSTGSLVDALERTLCRADSETFQSELRRKGAEVATRYEPSRILPKWHALLQRVQRERR